MTHQTNLLKVYGIRECSCAFAELRPVSVIQRVMR
jgi:hypothetical protein